MSYVYEEERRDLLDFFRTQINIHAQIITSVVVALFTQGIVTSFFPKQLDSWKIPLFMLGSGFFVCFAVVQYGKLFWNARLWNSTLIAKPKTFEMVYGESPTRNGIEETRISKLFLGTLDSMIEVCTSKEALLIFLGKKTRHELSFSCLAGSFSFFLSWWLSLVFLEPIVFPHFLSLCLLAVWIAHLAILIISLIYVHERKCCSTQQIRKWLRSDELYRLACGKNVEEKLIPKKQEI